MMIQFYKLVTISIGCIILLIMDKSAATPLTRGHTSKQIPTPPTHIVTEREILKALHYLVRRESDPAVRHEISHFLGRMRKLRVRRHIDGSFSEIAGKAYDQQSTRIFIRSLKNRFFQRQRECYNAILVFANRPDLFKAALEECG